MSFGVLDGDGNVAQIEGHPFGRIQFTGVRYAQADIRLLSPILPSKVVGIGKNYAEHVAEMNTGDAPKEPLMFLKPSTSVIGPEDGFGGTAPTLVFTPDESPKSGKLRLHIDLSPTDRDQDDELDRLMSLGARPADVGQTGDEPWHVLADPEGNEFCLLRRRVPA